MLLLYEILASVTRGGLFRCLLSKQRAYYMLYVTALPVHIQPPGGGFFHSKGTWGCAAHKGILFRSSSLAKGILFGNFSRV